MKRSFFKKIFIAVICSTLLPISLYSQNNDGEGIGLWTSIGAEKKIAKGFNADMEVEYRMRDNFDHTDRWTVGAGLSYRLYRNEDKTFSVKADLGYKYMNVWNAEERSDKDLYVHPDFEDYTFQEYNIDEAYNITKHRAYVSLSASYELGRFKFGLRERYQMTYNDKKQVMEHKYRYTESESAEEGETIVSGENDNIPGCVVRESEPEWKDAKTSNVFRSRFSIDYDIPNFKINPYCSVELFNNLNKNFALNKTRYIIGGEYTYKKVHSFKLYYQYQDQKSDDDPNSSVIGFNYKFEF